jgi:hypothetical protein
MKHLLSIPVLLIASVVLGQSMPVKTAAINAFIPSGFDTLQIATGDLNKDGKADLVLALKSKLEDAPDSVKEKLDSIPNRLLLVLLNTGDSYRSVVKAKYAILCKECGGVFGDPFSGIEIKNGLLVVEHYGGSAWRWSLTHKFRYQQNDFYLIGKTTYSFWDVKRCEKLDDYAGTDYKDENLVTGGYVEKKISEECKLLVNKKGKQKVQPLIKLSEFIIEN